MLTLLDLFRHNADPSSAEQAEAEPFLPCSLAHFERELYRNGFGRK